MTDLTIHSIGNRATVLACLPLSILLVLAISGCSSEFVDDNRDSVDTNDTSSDEPRANQTSALEQMTALPFTKKTSQNGQQRPLTEGFLNCPALVILKCFWHTGYSRIAARTILLKACL